MQGKLGYDQEEQAMMVDVQQRSCRTPHRPAKVKIAFADMNVVSHLDHDDADVLRTAFLTLTVR